MSNKLNAFAPGSGPGSGSTPATEAEAAPTTSNYKFQGVPISDLIEPNGTTVTTGYSGLKYNTTTDPVAKVGTDSFVNVFKIKGDGLPSNIKAKEYDISNNTTIPEWANAFRFRIQTNAGAPGNAGASGNNGKNGNDGATVQGETGQGYVMFGSQFHTHNGGKGGLGATGGNGGAGGAGGKGKEVYSDFFPIESGCTINTNASGFKITKDDTNVFNININAAGNGQNGFPGGDGNDGQNGQDAIRKMNGQQGYHGLDGANGFRETSANDANLNSDGNGKNGANGAASNFVSSRNDVLVSNDRNSTTGASRKIYFFKQHTTTTSS